MWPYVAATILASGGLWKLVAVLRCKREDIPNVASAITSVFTLHLPWMKRHSEAPGQDEHATQPPTLPLSLTEPPNRPEPPALPAAQNPAEPR